MRLAIRRARAEDVDFLVELTTHEDVDPFLAARRATTRDEIAAEIERSEREPQEYGRFVIEVDGERAGVMGFSLDNRRSRIAQLGGIAVHPRFRGRRVADDAARILQRHLLLELGYHRLQLEIYGFNERAIRHAERSGFVREGVKRKAYWRHDEWVDGVLYGLIREDLEDSNEGGRVGEERGIEETKEELDDSRTGEVPGMTETPDESLENDERRGDS